MKKTDSTEKKEFKAPNVERIEFEENDVIETSGEQPQYYVDRYGKRHFWDAGRGIYH